MTGRKIEEVRGRAIPLRGDDIDTDRIIPARYLICVTFDGLGEYAFVDDREQDKNHSFNNLDYAGSSILFVGDNFGCGSSREHAPQSLQKWGIQGIVGESFAEIFSGNCMAIGMPTVTASKDDMKRLFTNTEDLPGTLYRINLNEMKLHYAGQVVDISLPDNVRGAFLEGNWSSLSTLEANVGKARKLEKNLPYASWT